MSAFSVSEWHQRFATRFARIDSHDSFEIQIPILIERQADSHESLAVPIRANQVIRASRANRVARIMPLSSAFWLCGISSDPCLFWGERDFLHFPRVPRIRVRIADFENPTDRLYYYDRP